MKHYHRVFILLFEQMGMQKIYCGTLSFTALQVNPTMTTSAAEKPGNVKMVQGMAARIQDQEIIHHEDRSIGSSESWVEN